MPDTAATPDATSNTATALKTSGNPILPGWYADPEIHIFAGRYYIYPTCSMEYECQTYLEAWSSEDLTDWRNEGRILDLGEIPWSTNRCAWAPSAIERDGKYYLYFSAGDGAGLGVAVSDSPVGPFRDAIGKPLVGYYPHGAQPIDAHAFLDDDGQAYLYFGGHSHCVVVRLAADMVTLAGDFEEITPEHYVEGPFMFKRNGEYYFMWSEGGWGGESYSVAYARASSPVGPFKRIGRVLENNPEVGVGAGHNSVLNIPGTDEWYIVYHRRPPVTSSRHHRVTCIDRMEFDEDGYIRPVILTNTGVPARPITPQDR